MSAVRPLISGEEEGYVKFGLISKHEKTVKRTIQRLCGYYESGRSLSDTHAVRHLLFGHLSSENVDIRRYALKALALIGSPRDASRIIERLEVEKDIEAQSWAMSALASTRGSKKGRQLDRELGIDLAKAGVLSQMLYGRVDAQEVDKVSIALDHDDVLALKWSLFLIGYGKAPRSLFASDDHGAVAGELTQHDSEIVREYSAWALWERQEFGFAQSRIKLEDSEGQPASVRKWLYQLALKTPTEAGLTPDLLEDLARDNDIAAREGLARGAAMLEAEFCEPLTDWLRREEAESVKLELLEGLARNKSRSGSATALLLDIYSSSQSIGPERQRLLVASHGTPLYGVFRQLGDTDRQQYLSASLGLNQPSTNLILADTLHMTTYDNSINAGGDVNAQVLNSGTMIASANGAVQSISEARSDDKQILEQLLEWLKTSKISEEEKAAIAVSVELVSKEPTAENKKRLLDKLKDVAAGISKYGGVIGALGGILKIAQVWGAAG